MAGVRLARTSLARGAGDDEDDDEPSDEEDDEADAASSADLIRSAAAAAAMMSRLLMLPWGSLPTTSALGLCDMALQGWQGRWRRRHDRLELEIVYPCSHS